MLLCKRLYPLFFCLLLAACGFHPLYTSYQDNTCVSYPLKIATIKDRQGQILRNYLVDLLIPGGAPSCPLYELEVDLVDSVRGIGVNKDETTSRKEAILTAVIRLRKCKTSAIVYAHSVKAINSFAVRSGNYYSDTVAEEYAKKEATRLLAEKIKIVLSAYLDSCHEN